MNAEVFSKKVGKTAYKVRVFDASPNGCKIEFVERPKLDDQMVLKFEGLEPLHASVCWVDGFTGGIEFAKPIHPAVFHVLVLPKLASV